MGWVLLCLGAVSATNVAYGVARRVAGKRNPPRNKLDWFLLVAWTGAFLWVAADLAESMIRTARQFGLWGWW